MDAEPDTLSLWSTMVAALKSHISYGPGVKQLVSDINVTDIFIKRDGARDEDAITFWGQLISVQGVKMTVETMLSHSLKRGKDRGKVVQRIPLSRNTEITEEFIAFVTTKIRNTPSLWSVGAVNVIKSKAPTEFEIEVTETIPEFPITPGPTETISMAKEQERTRKYSQRQMQGSLLDKSYGWIMLVLTKWIYWMTFLRKLILK
jgi:hypothetical protein